MFECTECHGVDQDIEGNCLTCQERENKALAIIEQGFVLHTHWIQDHPVSNCPDTYELAPGAVLHRGPRFVKLVVRLGVDDWTFERRGVHKGGGFPCESLGKPSSKVWGEAHTEAEGCVVRPERRSGIDRRDAE